MSLLIENEHVFVIALLIKKIKQLFNLKNSNLNDLIKPSVQISKFPNDYLLFVK